MATVLGMYTQLAVLAGGFGSGHRRMGGRHPGLWLIAALLVGAAIVIAALVVRSRRPQGTPQSATGSPVGSGPPSPAAHAEAILSERFARGEVSVEEFVVARQALRGEWVPTPAASTTTLLVAEPPPAAEPQPASAPLPDPTVP